KDPALPMLATETGLLSKQPLSKKHMLTAIKNLNFIIKYHSLELVSFFRYWINKTATLPNG
ncbi:hypothetical protein QTN94_19975, partial [Vibrio sp. M250220]|uniref:hypothetical protein n=1 Tax=Vibrio sp. M250220 TaxID=3020894 RepID=UPI002F41AF55